jgi:DNA-binding NarL/FixJ family response regulator
MSQPSNSVFPSYLLPECQKISLLFVEELALYREGLTCLFTHHPDFELLGSSHSGISLVDLLIQRPADMGLVDLHLTDIHAFEVVRRARAAGVETRLILMATRADPRTATEGIRGGAQGMVLKSTTSSQLVEACRQVMSGAVYIDPRIELAQTLTNVVRRDPGDPLEALSSREHQVFSLLIEGVRAKEIAARLAVSPKTVDTYRASLMRKLNIHDVAGLVKYAIQRQLITTE